MIFHYLDASAIGGIETHVETLALAQIASGKSVSVILHAEYSNSPVRKRYENAGLEVHIAGSLAGLFKLLRRLSPDILHTHGYKAGIGGRLVARVQAIPVITTFHAGERGKGRMALYQSVDEWSSFLGGRLAVSQAIADKMPFETKMMRNFVPPAPVSRPVPQETRFVFAGRLSHEKGPDLFCELAATNKHCGNFDLYGEGPMREELEARHGDALTFHGFANNIKSVLSQTSALVMTSRNEGLPMIALEAMALGVPVIAPAIGALPDLIIDGNNGFLFEVENPAALDHALQAFGKLDRDQLAGMGEAARQTITSRFSPGVVLPDLFEAYRSAGWKSSRSTRTNVQSSIG